MSEAREALAEALRERSVLIVGGAGGVGKTTTAAALGVRAALLGRRVLVCTIDPSRRLATSLGLAQLPDRPRPIDLARLGQETDGAMWAMTLDTKRTFDTLVERYTPDPAARDRILGNRFYQQLSSALVGSHEYMAMEKLLELTQDDRFDLLILDTPPTRHALDFLEAPERLLGFLDQSVLRWFLKPYFAAGKLTLKIATRTGALALKLADRVLGLQFLQDVSEFFLAFESMYAGFKERAARVYELLRQPGSAFVVVASPAPMTLEEGLYFQRRLRERSMPFLAFVVNRVHPDPAAGRPRRRGDVVEAGEVDEALREELTSVFRDQQRVARAERRTIDRMEEQTGEQVVVVPEFEGDVHDLRGLCSVAEAIFGGPVKPAAARKTR